jgi:thiosulfate/3-mercaptopyruvate sulfurtransferase
MRRSATVKLGIWISLPLVPAAAQQPSDPAPVVVSTEWLAGHLSDAKLVVFHVGSDASFAAAHIPGSRPLALSVFSPDRDGLTTEMPEAPAFQSVLTANGVSADSRIVVYSATASPVLAARLYVTLDHFGLGAQTSLLDGGLTAWRTENRAVATGPATEVSPGTLALRRNADIVVTYEEVGARMADRAAQILDARDARFHSGAQFNQARAARPGRVAGALNVPFGSVVDAAGRLLPRDSLARLFSAAGVTGRDVITYCHVGQQASLLFVAARAAGLVPRLYDGSYEDWSRHPAAKVDSGTVRPPGGDNLHQDH